MAVLDNIKDLFKGQASRGGGTAQTGGINKKTVAVGTLLIVSVLMMVVMFIIEGGQARKNKLYTTIASEQQVISQQIAVNALEAAGGQEPAFDRLAQNQGRFLANLEKFNNGDSLQSLPPLPESLSVEYTNMKAVWNDYDKNIATVVAAKASIGTVSDCQASMMTFRVPLA